MGHAQGGTGDVSKEKSSVNIRTSREIAAIKQAILDNLICKQGRFMPVATDNDIFLAVAYTARDHILAKWANTARTYFERESRTVCYLSAEYLLGPQLETNLLNMGLHDQFRQAVEEMGLDFEAVVAQECEPGLGNGGLGRLAACFLDSLATLNVPAIAYGIRYEFGLFTQEIRAGEQRELADQWLGKGNPWEVARPEIAYEVPFGGRVQPDIDDEGRFVAKWIPERLVKGVAFDTMIPGYQCPSVTMLRLFRAEATSSFDLASFNTGDYYSALEEKITSEVLTKVLYPNDQPQAGRRLRLMQEFFLVSCALQDMIRIYLQRASSMHGFSAKYAIQLNDTHPALAIAELMRLLVDQYRLGWEEAWGIASKVFGYTNHTLLPEALEKWDVDLFAELLPRHLEIVYEINRRFLDEIRRRYPSDEDLVRRLSIIEEERKRCVRTANLACIASRKINGVSELHTQRLSARLLPGFFKVMPEKFCNITNGVTQRRFLAVCNPLLSDLISRKIGKAWIKDLSRLRELEAWANDEGFMREWQQVKIRNKERLSALINARTGVVTDPSSLFDIQAKRIHEYKRQHLNVLHLITLYNRIKKGSASISSRRTAIFSGKAAPGYEIAKLIIRLIHGVAEVINSDPKVCRELKVAFLPDLNVKNAHLIYPAGDLSEQISTAGTEASGTGNMKFAMNGALTIGTPDGANLEIMQEVGAENLFIFGQSAQEIDEKRTRGYCPRDEIESNNELREAIELIESGLFSRGDRELFRPITQELRERDRYFLCADYASYMATQQQAGRTYTHADEWTRMSILNVSRIGRFSSDRAVKEYCRQVWDISPVEID